jgi:hypothetical protein
MIQTTERLIRQNSEFIQSAAIPLLAKNIEILESLIEMNRSR